MKADRGPSPFDAFGTIYHWRETPQPRNRKHEPIVYYMRLDRLVKIGWTSDLRRRFASIQPHGVLAIEPGGPNIEELRHIEFAAHRSHREWFWLRPQITDHIVKIRAELEEREGITTETWLEQHSVYAPPTMSQGPGLDG